MTNRRTNKSGQRSPISDLDETSPSGPRPAWQKWTFGIGLLAIAIGWLVQHARKLDELATFERDGGAILEAAASWREQHSQLGCPTLSQLIQDHFLPQSAQQGGKRFRILCSADEVHVEKLDENGKPMDDALRLNQHVAPHEG